MDCTSTLIPYQQTGQFSRIITDYLAGAPELQHFISYPVSYEGILAAIENRKQFPVNRILLTDFLSRQYSSLPAIEQVNKNIELLKDENTFSIVTAHQPNIFTGHLYFVYKILHVVKLAEDLSIKFPGYKFVPVFYMGSEDADLEELGHIFLNGEKLTWETTQKGAVGRMSAKGLDKITRRLEGELDVYPFGKELMKMLDDSYQNSSSIQEATLKIVHALFGEYGLVTIIPDDPGLKATMREVFADDLLHQTASGIVEKSIKEISQHYKVQAQPREINLFYLKDDIRSRIVKTGNEWKVTDTNIRFSEKEIMKELDEYPERFSPNVILRGLFQEKILPDIAFIGGGGETAYWLELKALFAHYRIAFPVLVLRNSFLFVEAKWKRIMEKLGLDVHDMFQPEFEIIKDIVEKRSTNKLTLSVERQAIADAYTKMKEQASVVDPTLSKHVDNLFAGASRRLETLEKKMMRAEKRKFEDESRQVQELKLKLFPQNGLQERVDNLLPFYAKYGRGFLQAIYQNSLSLEQEFVVLVQEQP